MQGERKGTRAASPSLLVGKVIDAFGNALIASHATKGARRYRYYVSKPDAAGPTVRIPATELETAVTQRLASAFDDPVELCARSWLEVTPTGLTTLAERAAEHVARLKRRERAPVRSLVAQVRVLEESIKVDCDIEAIAAALGVKIAEDAPPNLTLSAPVRLQRSGMAMRLVQPGGAGISSSPSQSLIRMVVKARRWWRLLKEGEFNIAALARREGVTRSYMTRIVRLAFLAPAVIDAILAGAAKAGVDAEKMTTPGAIDARWADQVAKLLPSRAGLGIMSAH